MAPLTCPICNEVVSEANDHYRQLDCSFRGCPGEAYHEDCVGPYLRKNGHGSEQKTGYPCPATLGNGRPCPGRIKKTHVKTPTNAKKKELQCQAAVTVNNITNMEATKTKQSRGIVKGQLEPSKQTNPLAKPNAAKIASGSILSAPNTKRQIVVSNGPDQEDAPAPRPQPTMADFMTGPVQVRTLISKLNNPKNADMFKRAPAMINSFKVAPAQGSSAGRVASAASRNAAMAPEPVVRQPFVPGWSGALKVAKPSTVDKRALVAELRAELAAAGRGGKKTTVAVAAPPLGALIGTGGAVLEAGAGTGVTATLAQSKVCDSRIRTPVYDDAPAASDRPPAQVDQLGRTNSSTVGTPASLGPAAMVDFDLFPEQFPALGGGQAATASSLPPYLSFDEDDEANTEPLSEPSTPSSNPAPSSEPDADGVYYVPVYYMADGTAVVGDAEGIFYSLVDCFGPEPELVVGTDEAGNVAHYVVVRNAPATVHVAAPGCGYGGSDSLPSSSETATPDAAAAIAPAEADASVMHMGAIEAPAVCGSAGRQVGHGAGASEYYVDVSRLPTSTPGGAVEDEDELDDLLALCLGK